MTRTIKTTALLAGLGLLVAGCQTVRDAVPFIGNDDEGPQAIATEGERVSILSFDERLEVSPALASATYSLPAPRAVTSWALPGGNLEQAVEHADAGAGFEIAWRRDVGEGSSGASQITAPLIAAENRIFTMDGHARVTAFDATTGDELWHSDLRRTAAEAPGWRNRLSFSSGDREAFGGGLAFAGGKVFVVSGYRIVTALDAATGEELWSVEVESPIHGAPTVASGRVFAIDVDNQILAFDVNTGAQTWSYQAIIEPARILRASTPAVLGETVLAPFSSGEIVALRATNGQAIWQQVLSRTNRTNALSEIRDIAGRPAIYRGTVYAASHSGVFAAMDARTGARRWELPVASVNTPWPAGDVVFIVSTAGELISVNRENGQAYWIQDLNEGRERNEGGVFGIGDRTVRPVWTGPLLASNRLILVNSDGEAVAFNARSGEPEATLRLGGPAFISPIAYQGMIYVLTDEGDLVAIR